MVGKFIVSKIYIYLLLLAGCDAFSPKYMIIEEAYVVKCRKENSKDKPKTSIRFPDFNSCESSKEYEDLTKATEVQFEKDKVSNLENDLKIAKSRKESEKASLKVKNESRKKLKLFKSKFTKDHNNFDKVDWYKHRKMPLGKEPLALYIGENESGVFYRLALKTNTSSWIFFDEIELKIDGWSAYVPFNKSEKKWMHLDTE